MSKPEVWLRGPLEGFPPILMPVAQALMQASEDLGAALDLTPEQLWLRPGGAASVGFHLRHLVGSTDRLLTYAAGQQLSEEQLGFLRGEGEPSGHAAQLVAQAREALEGAVEGIRRTPEASLFEPREVGRARLPSTVIGLLYHLGEHSSRHAGQIITTAKVVRGLGGLAKERINRAG